MQTMKNYMNDSYNYVSEFTPKGVPTGKWTLVPYPNIKSSAAGYLRVQTTPTPRKIFQHMMKQIWDSLKNVFPSDTPAEVKLQVYRFWFNNEHLRCIVIPVPQQ